MRILITGGSGLLGQYLNIRLSEENEIMTLYNSNKGNCHEYNSKKITLTDYQRLKDIVYDYKPEIIIHTAAISRPETCDQLPSDYVNEVNVNLTKEIALLCEKNNAKLIFTSTDLVYDGDSGQLLDENSSKNPVSLYAETKLKSEDEIKNIFENYIILRTSLLFGTGLNHSVNNFHTMHLNLMQKKKVKLFYDQFRTPLSLNDAAELISKLIDLNIVNITLNFGGAQRVSRVELGEILCEIGKYDKNLIEKISMDDIGSLHKVADVSMNTDRLRSLGLRQKSIEDAVKGIVDNLK